jgi:GT2 family glycosyltransferase
LIAGWTASAGAAIAIHRQRFLKLGGFDPLYLPGRLEDLDFAFRGYMAGYAAQYVPQSVAWHWGQASFQEAFGAEGCELLALRNTLLFQWKNLRHPAHLLRQATGIPIRLAFDLLRAAWQPRERRLAFWRAFCGAVARVRSLRRSPYRAAASWRNESAYFRRFKFASMASREPVPDSAALPAALPPCVHPNLADAPA